MEPRAECPTVLLPDKPSPVDEFGDGERAGPHQRLADSLLLLVTTNEGGKTIGLEGGWGAGKSTVIELLQDRARNTPSLQVVIVDAWSHQGDPLRRTFLETVGHQLVDAGWLDKPKWTKKLDEIAQRRKVTKTDPSLVLKPLGKLLAMSLLLVPIGISLLNEGLRRGGFNLPLAAAIVFLAAPVVLMAWKARDDEFWGIFVHKLGIPTTTISIENPDPTSVEFEKEFRGLLKDALPEGRTLLIVLDNLDRVMRRDALAILATLQTFLSEGELAPNPPLERLWVIIPYDPTGLRRLWTSNLSHDASGEVNDTGAEQDSYTGDLATSMIDKRFQVRLSVPPLVLSDWRAYLARLCSKSLPKHSPSEFDLVYEVFRRIAVPPGSTPTPRYIKVFVNQVASLHAQVQDLFPLPLLAYYAIIQMQGRDVVKALNDGSIPEKSIGDILGEEPGDKLAALWFGAPVPLSRQYRLLEPFRSALLAGDHAALATLFQSSDGSPAVLDLVDFDAFTLEQLASAALALRLSRALDTLDDASILKLKGKVRRAFLSDKSAPAPSTALADALRHLLALLGDEPSALALLAKVSATTLQSEETEVAPADIDAWTTFASSIIGECASLIKDKGKLQGAVRIPFNSVGTLLALSRMHEDDPEGQHWPVFRIAVPDKALTAMFAKVVGAGNIAHFGIPALRVLKRLSPVTLCGQVVKEVDIRLSQATAISPSELGVLLDALAILDPDPVKLQARFQDMVQKSIVAHHIASLSAKKDIPLLARLIFLQIRFSSAPAQQPVFGSSVAGMEHIAKILGAPESNPGVLAQCAAQFNGPEDVAGLLAFEKLPYDASPFVDACIGALAQAPNVTAMFTPALMLANWRRFFDALEDDASDALLKRLVDAGHLGEYISAGFDTANAPLYSSIVRCTGGSERAFVEWIAAAIAAVRKETWIDQFTHEGDLVELVLRIADLGTPLALGTEFLDALGDHAKLYVARESTPKRHADSWHLLPSAIGSSHGRNTFRRRLFEIMKSAKGQFDPALFALYSEDLPDAKAIAKDVDAIYDLLTPLLDRRDSEGLSWIARVVQSDPSSILENPNPDAVADFRERIGRALVGEAPEEDLAQVSMIAAALGIEPLTDHGATSAPPEGTPDPSRSPGADPGLGPSP